MISKEIFINILIGLVTIYTTFLQFCSASIRVLLIRYNKSNFFGERFILRLYNTSLSSINVEAVYLIFDSKKKLLVKEYEIPLLVEARRSFQIEIEPISNYLSNSDVRLDERCLVFIKLSDGNSISTFSTSGLKGRVEVWIKNYKFLRRLKKDPRNVLDSLDSIEWYRICYGDIVLRDTVRFVLLIRMEGDEHTIFITKHGMTSENWFSDKKWKSCIETATYEEVKERLKKEFEGESVEFELYNVEDVSKLELSNLLEYNLNWEVLKKWNEHLIDDGFSKKL